MSRSPLATLCFCAALAAALSSGPGCSSGGKKGANGDPRLSDTDGTGAATATGNKKLAPHAGPPAGKRAEAPSRRLALLVGINHYKAADKIPPLRGAVADVAALRDVLVGRFAFLKDDVVVLTNGHATHEAIVKAFREHLIAKADAKTVVVFY